LLHPTIKITFPPLSTKDLNNTTSLFQTIFGPFVSFNLLAPDNNPASCQPGK
jgi:hypothetical protein